MERINILYIHGHGSTGNSRTTDALQECYGSHASVFHPLFSNNVDRFDQMLSNIETANSFITSHHIDLVVGSSLGGFVAHSLRGVPKILINPCLKPSEQIALRIAPKIAATEIEKYRQHENSITIGDLEKNHTIGVFGNHDELFSYKPLFEQLYGTNFSFWMNDGHRISVENVSEIVVPLVSKLLA